MTANRTVKRIPVAPVQPLSKRGMLTVGEVCTELQIAPSTFYEWRTKRTGPRCIKLPNGQLRVRRADLETWLDAREDAA
jgi:predicted DNA-binding transcriptional regulator AlpA